jgi:hypothetical protein
MAWSVTGHMRMLLAIHCGFVIAGRGNITGKSFVNRFNLSITFFPLLAV